MKDNMNIRTIIIDKPKIDQLCVVDFGGRKLGLIKKVGVSDFYHIYLWDKSKIDWVFGFGSISNEFSNLKIKK